MQVSFISRLFDVLLVAFIRPIGIFLFVVIHVSLKLLEGHSTMDNALACHAGGHGSNLDATKDF